MSDHAQTLRQLAEVLERQNYAVYRVAACLSGADALVRAKQCCGNCRHFASITPGAVRGFCLVFADGRMPDDACRKGWATREAE